MEFVNYDITEMSFLHIGKSKLFVSGAAFAYTHLGACRV